MGHVTTDLLVLRIQHFSSLNTVIDSTINLLLITLLTKYHIYVFLKFFHFHPKISYSDFNRKVSVITGAASGQGRATSLLLTKQGAKLGLLDLNYPEYVLNKIKQLGGEAIGF